MTSDSRDKPLLVTVTSRFPWPLDHGFAIRIYWQLRLLSPKYRIRLHVLSSSPPSRDAMERIMPFCETITIHRTSRVEALLYLAGALFTGDPLQNALFETRSARRAIERDLAEADAAMSITIRTAPLILGFDGPRFLDLADSLGQTYAVNAANDASRLWRLIYGFEGRRMIRYERHAIAICDASFMFNAKEAAALASCGRVVPVPHGVDPQLFEVDRSGTAYADGVVVFGKMNYRPNVDCALWFADKVLPLLDPDIRLYVVGSHPADELIARAAADPRVVVTGFVDDPYPDIRGSIVNVCPIRMGGGIQNKVIEALAIGAPTLISPLAAVPFPDLVESGLLVCSDPTEWAERIHALRHASMAERERTAETGRAYARAHFSWEAYADAIDAELSRSVNRRAILTPDRR